jgi:hypothetical protein
MSSYSHYAFQTLVNAAKEPQGNQAAETHDQPETMIPNSQRQTATPKALQNDVYSNVDIDLPPPPKKSVCEMAGDQSGHHKLTGDQKADDNNETPDLGGSSKQSTHKWLWLAGLAGGIFILGRATNT